MASIDIFYQGEGLLDIQHLEVAPEATFGVVKALLLERHAGLENALLFVEEEEEPIEDAVCVKDRALATGLKIHLHRCRYVETTVAFNGHQVERRFSPAATVARVKHWAAVEKFGMTAEEAGEHVLQIAGKHDRPAPGTHIGTLTDGRVCGVAFDLVPDQRVNGAAGWAV
jgi:hypothetical protein